MAKSYYAWTDIRSSSDKSEKPVVISRGTKVTASDLGISTEEFQEKIDAGAIRDKPFPAPDDYSGSAIDYLRDQLAEATGSSTQLEEAEAQGQLEMVESKTSQ